MITQSPHRITPWIVACFFLIAGVPLLNADTPPAPKDRKAKITVFEEAPKETDDTEGPGFKMEQRLRQLTRQSEEKLDEAIETLKELIQAVPDDAPDKPEFNLALADAYWERSESFFEKAYNEDLEAGIYNAMKAGNTAEADSLKAEQQSYLDQQKQWRVKTVEVYRTIVETFDSHEKLDEILYYLGLHETLVGERENGFDTYKQLLKAHSRSPYVPSALVNMGEFFFEDNEFDTALLFYEKVRNGFPSNVVYPFAVYKSAWCYYNMGEYDRALNNFLEVIRHSESQPESERGRIELKKEAQKDLVKAYAASGGNPSRAIGFFKKVVPSVAMDLTLSLADHYSNQGKFKESIQLYYKLIEADSASHMVLKYQRRIVNAVYNQGLQERTAKEVESMLQLYQIIGAKAPQAWLVEEKKGIESELRVIATTWHQDGQTSSDDKQLEAAASLYRDYLRFFPDGQHAYAITRNYALVLKSLNRYQEAGLQFERVLELEPEGEFAGEAAYFSMFNFAQKLEQQEQRIKSEEESGLLTREEFPELEQKMLTAFKRYIRLARPDDEELPGALFRVAMLYYDFNHFNEAIPLLERLITEYQGHPSAPSAAKVLLSSLHHSHDFEKKQEWAMKLADTPLATGDLSDIVTSIRDKVEFNKCFRFEKSKEFVQAAQCFRSYTQSYPKANDIDQAWFNAAVLFERGKQYLDSLNALETLLQSHGKSPMAAKSLFQRGEIFRKLGFYTDASESYEIFVRKHPKHDKAKAALAQASRFRMGLGNYKEALKNYKKYLKMADESEKARIEFAAGGIYEKQEKWPAVEKHYRAFIKKYQDKDDSLSDNARWILGAQLKVGMALWKRKKFKKAVEMFQSVVNAYNASPGTYRDGALGFVAEAQFMLGEQALRNAMAIRFTGRKVQETFDKKVAAVQEARKIFKQVINLRQPNWVIAGLNRVGMAYEELADAIKAMPRPKTRDEYLLEEFEANIFKKAEEVIGRASNAYSDCLAEATRLQWFNKYSEQAAEQLAKLDYSFRFMKEYKAKPTYSRANAALPGFRFGRALQIKKAPPAPKTETIKTPSKPPVKEEVAP